jgi:hypothetical protein
LARIGDPFDPFLAVSLVSGQLWREIGVLLEKDTRVFFDNAEEVLVGLTEREEWEWNIATRRLA